MTSSAWASILHCTHISMFWVTTANKMADIMSTCPYTYNHFFAYAGTSVFRSVMSTDIWTSVFGLSPMHTEAGNLFSVVFSAVIWLSDLRAHYAQADVADKEMCCLHKAADESERRALCVVWCWWCCWSVCCASSVYLTVRRCSVCSPSLMDEAIVGIVANILLVLALCDYGTQCLCMSCLCPVSVCDCLYVWCTQETNTQPHI